MVNEFVITYGPPGCGKSSITEKVYPNHIHINVDNILLEIEGFLTQSQIISMMIKQGIHRNKIEKESEYIYRNYRDEADRRSEFLLKRALDECKNIVFETTGGSEHAILYLKKIIPEIKNKDYKVKIIFPHAPINIIKERVYVRGEAARRLPSENFIEAAYEYACKNFGDIANICDEVEITDSTNGSILYRKSEERSSSRSGYAKQNIVLIHDDKNIQSLPIALIEYILSII